MEKCLEVGKFTKIDMKLTKNSAQSLKKWAKSWEILEGFDGNRVFLMGEKCNGIVGGGRIVGVVGVQVLAENVRVLGNLLSVCDTS